MISNEQKLEKLFGGKFHKRLAYHHWNKIIFSLGIWVCQKCHWLIEYCDEKSSEEIIRLIKKYKILRKELEND